MMSSTSVQVKVDTACLRRFAVHVPNGRRFIVSYDDEGWLTSVETV